MPAAGERLRRQFAKIVNAVCRTMELKIDGDQEKIDKYFDEWNDQAELPEGLTITSRFDTVEKDHNELETKMDAYIGRPWWRRFLGLSVKKQTG